MREEGGDGPPSVPALAVLVLADANAEDEEGKDEPYAFGRCNCGATCCGKGLEDAPWVALVPAVGPHNRTVWSSLAEASTAGDTPCGDQATLLTVAE